MAFLEHKCTKCGLEGLAFDNEVDSRLCSSSDGCKHEWKSLQPIVCVVHSTDLFERVILDSINSIRALCTKITIEAREQSELKAYLDMKKNI
jgi:hypothetical protein